MRNLIALLYFLCALLGCDTGGTTLVTRTSVDGHDSLQARSRVQTGIDRFECIASDSGRCHYALFARECAPNQPNCRTEPFERFSMPVGADREIVGLPARFDLCVTQSAAPPTLTPDCKLPQPEASVAVTASSGLPAR